MKYSSINDLFDWFIFWVTLSELIDYCMIIINYLTIYQICLKFIFVFLSLQNLLFQQIIFSVCKSLHKPPPIIFFIISHTINQGVLFQSPRCNKFTRGNHLSHNSMPELLAILLMPDNRKITRNKTNTNFIAKIANTFGQFSCGLD